MPCSGGHPEWHIQGDALQVAAREHWDLKIGFPPCDHLSVSGARWFEEKRRDGRQQKGIEFFIKMAEICDALENPIGIMSGQYIQKHFQDLYKMAKLIGFPRKPDQIIQPWQFGHGETKSTCLWLRNLPKLSPTNIVDGRDQKVWKMPPSADRAKLRSKTYEGIAQAMAIQWGCI